MPSHTGLLRRGNRYFIRRKIPADLRGVVKGREIKYTLKTSDPKEAKRRAAAEWLKIEAQFEDARRKAAPAKSAVSEISEAQRWQLVAKWFGEMDSASEREFRDTYGKLPPEERREIEIDQDLEEICLTGGNDDFSAEDCGRRLDTLLQREGLELPKDSESYRALKQALRKARLENIRRNRKRLHGEPLPTGGISRFDASYGGAPAHSTNPKPDCTLGELLKRFMDEKRKSGVSTATVRAYSIPVRILQDILGNDFLLCAITRETMADLRDKLRALPVNARQRFKGKPLDAVLKQAEGKPQIKRLDGKTAENYFNFVSAIFNFAVDLGLMTGNPAKSRSLRDSFKCKRKKNGKAVFSIDELNKMFHAPLYTGCKDDGNGYATKGPNVPRSGRFWVPLLGLWHGLRLNEACQLYTEDVRTMDGVLCLLIREYLDTNAKSEKNLKTQASERTVPVHPQLLKMGFAAFVEQRRKNGKSPRLFPELGKAETGYFSDNFSKWFGRFLAHAIGYQPRGATFHSFRHMFRDALRNADVSIEKAEALGGWTSHRSEEARYGSGFSMPALRREIEKVKYEGLDLTHLENN